MKTTHQSSTTISNNLKSKIAALVKTEKKLDNIKYVLLIILSIIGLSLFTLSARDVAPGTNKKGGGKSH